jgi:hypothetical protein
MTQPQLLLPVSPQTGPPVEPSAHCQLGIPGAGPVHAPFWLQSTGAHARSVHMTPLGAPPVVLISHVQVLQPSLDGKLSPLWYACPL